MYATTIKTGFNQVQSAAYFFGLHLFGAICLLGWIQYCDPKYRNVLAQSAQNRVWWCVSPLFIMQQTSKVIN